ncbi:hypothetical protein DCAR_0934740 [Daucus carota subsp. sativus]|uniref:GRF-type domain-containing protein n=1 Tax=Daucus carota subsp. sativus TaxID=79200 RepID=A0AAF1BEL1_DAUCS|nr:PREDICTED: uncharacterized protein At4g04775-like [Daucus carota subsp. sativus]WOH15203.1 hypothetical protein DCAR_0934740 [Daucus carota subsp. sativus]
MTSNGSHGRSTSIESVKNWEHKHCFCGKIARLCTSWTLKNPGRRFYTCAVAKDVQGCHFFQWCDEAFTGRAFDVVTHLNHRRLYLEEKLKLVEEDLEQSCEKRKLLKAERLKLVEERAALEIEKNC